MSMHRRKAQAQGGTNVTERRSGIAVSSPDAALGDADSLAHRSCKMGKLPVSGLPCVDGRILTERPTMSLASPENEFENL
jgi:hypothetical protein